MSVHVIYYQEGAKMMRPLHSPEEYRALRGTPRQKQLVTMARQGDDDAKRHLVQMNYSLAPTAPETPLKGCTAISMSVGMDVDLDKSAPDYEQKMREVPSLILAKKDELGLLMLERSASKGYHIVFRRHADMTQEENLRWASDLLGVQYDEGAKDITRVFFTTTDSDEDLLFLDDELFDNTPCHAELTEQREQCHVRMNNAESRGKKTEGQRNAVESKDSTPTLPSTPAELAGDSSTTAEASAQNDGTNDGLSYDGVPYALIIQEWWNLTNGGKTPFKSNRDALTYELAVNLRNICGFERQLLARVIPCYDEFPEAEKMKCIDSALQSPRTQMPPRLKQVIQRARVKMANGITEADSEDAPDMFDFVRRETPPDRPKRLPPLLKLLTSKVPERQVPTTAMSVFPALGAHLCGVTIRDTDNTTHEPAFMHLQIARSSTGKSCINQPIEMILADIKESDRKARDERREWVKTTKKLGANKEKPPRPTGCVQVTDINMTAAALTQLLYDAEQAGNKALYTRMDEVEMLGDLGAGSGLGPRGVSKILRLGYDHAMWGQERVGVDSVNERAPLRWFWNASGTIQRCIEYLGGSIADGTLSRLSLSTITERGSRPTYGDYDEAFARELRPYILRLNAASGEVRCEQAERAARRLSDDVTIYQDTLIGEDDVISAWAPRAVTMALMRAIVLYIAEGYQWSKDMENFMIWSYQYDMWCKFHFFGERAELEMGGEVVTSHNKKGRPSVLKLLPDTFTLADMDTALKATGKVSKSKTLLRKWKERGMVVVGEDGICSKVRNRGTL